MTTRTTRIKIPQNDYGWDLIFTCRDFTGAVVNITGFTIHFKVWEFNKPGVLLVNGVGAAVDAVNGIAKYTLAVGDFPTVGEFQGELEATKLGEVSSYQSFIVEVTESG